MSNQFYYCTRAKLYSYLVEKGHTPIQVIPNYFKPKYIVWVFQSNEKLEADVSAYFESIKQ